MHDETKHRGWYSRGYLPHLDAIDCLQAVTFRLADALPQSVVDRWKNEVTRLGTSSQQIARELRTRICRYEDAGHGSCVLRDPANAQIVQHALLHFHGERYHLLEWCIMPNHVHVLLRLVHEHPLNRVIKSWKTYTARQINLRMACEGSLWQRDYHDRYIRDLNHLEDCRAYIRKNPVKAGLCQKPGDWPWSSASAPRRSAGL